MKHLKLLLSLALLGLLAGSALATIEVQTTTPPVPVDGIRYVGQMRLIFSFPELGCNTFQNTTYYTMIRIRSTRGVKFVSIGGVVPTPTTPIALVVEPDGGAWDVPTTIPELNVPHAFQVVRLTNDFIDILCSRNMQYNGAGVPYPLTTSQRIRVTIGTPDFVPVQGATVTDQPDTRICADFRETGGAPDDDFDANDKWTVGMYAYYSDITATAGVMDDLCTPGVIDPKEYFPVNFQPANPALALKGTAEICNITWYWPLKGDRCNPEACDQGPAESQTCPQPPVVQDDPPPCDDSWSPYPGVIEFGQCHWFAITETRCTPTNEWVFEPLGALTVTLRDDTSPVDIDPEFCEGAAPRAIIIGGGMTTPYVIDSAYITVGADTITIELPDDIWYNPDRTSAYCILVDLDQICYDPCPMLEVSADANVDVLVDIGWTSAGANECGGIDLTTGPIMVAEVWGCEEPEPEPEDYWLVLYFPFLAPVNNTEVNWWCGVAVSNYANQATNGGWFYMWEEDGDAYAVEVPALGGHEMWLRNLTDMTFERMPGNTDATAADEAMSGILMMQVTTPDYYRNYETSGLFDGAIAGIDAFVLMGDGDQAYGYTARHISAFGEFLFDPFSGRAPIWNKARK